MPAGKLYEIVRVCKDARIIHLNEHGIWVAGNSNLSPEEQRRTHDYRVRIRRVFLGQIVMCVEEYAMACGGAYLLEDVIVELTSDDLEEVETQE